MNLKTITFLTAYSILFSSAGAQTNLNWEDSDGISKFMVITEETSFNDVIEQLCSETNSEKITLTVSKKVDNQGITVAKIQRVYGGKVSSKDLKDIEFIITKMAWEKNLKKLWDLEKDLKAAGDRIDHIHPLQFLEIICLNDKLCTGLKAIKDRTTLVWPRFLKGNVDTFEEEDKKDNIYPFITKFAEKINLDIRILSPYVESKDWAGFVKVVAARVERNHNPNRYNM